MATELRASALANSARTRARSCDSASARRRRAPPPRARHGRRRRPRPRRAARRRASRGRLSVAKLRPDDADVGLLVRQQRAARRWREALAGPGTEVYTPLRTMGCRNEIAAASSRIPASASRRAASVPVAASRPARLDPRCRVALSPSTSTASARALAEAIAAASQASTKRPTRSGMNDSICFASARTRSNLGSSDASSVTKNGFPPVACQDACRRSSSTGLPATLDESRPQATSVSGSGVRCVAPRWARRSLPAALSGRSPSGRIARRTTTGSSSIRWTTRCRNRSDGSLPPTGRRRRRCRADRARRGSGRARTVRGDRRRGRLARGRRQCRSVLV